MQRPTDSKAVVLWTRRDALTSDENEEDERMAHERLRFLQSAANVFSGMNGNYSSYIM
jgi:hypothetical protein